MVTITLPVLFITGAPTGVITQLAVKKLYYNSLYITFFSCIFPIG